MILRWLRGHRVYILHRSGRRRVVRFWSTRPAMLHAQTQSYRSDVEYTVCDGAWFANGRSIPWAG